MLADKRRDMARSVLPSTKRVRAATALAAVRRRHRRAVRRQLACLTGPVDDARLIEFELGVDERFPTHLVHSVVIERRGGDKVGPLMRWAVASSRSVRREDRLSHLAAMLPMNLIGAHAISHLACCEEFATDGPENWTRIEAHRRHPLDSREVLAERVGQLLKDGKHGALNALLKNHSSQRPLLGHHDVKDFAEGVLATERIWVRSERWWVPGGLLCLSEQLKRLTQDS